MWHKGYDVCLRLSVSTYLANVMCGHKILLEANFVVWQKSGGEVQERGLSFVCLLSESTTEHHQMTKTLFQIQPAACTRSLLASQKTQLLYLLATMRNSLL